MSDSDFTQPHINISNTLLPRDNDSGLALTRSEYLGGGLKSVGFIRPDSTNLNDGENLFRDLIQPARRELGMQAYVIDNNISYTLIDTTAIVLTPLDTTDIPTGVNVLSISFSGASGGPFYTFTTSSTASPTSVLQDLAVNITSTISTDILEAQYDPELEELGIRLVDASRDYIITSTGVNRTGLLTSLESRNLFDFDWTTAAAGINSVSGTTGLVDGVNSIMFTTPTGDIIVSEAPGDPSGAIVSINIAGGSGTGARINEWNVGNDYERGTFVYTMEFPVSPSGIPDLSEQIDKLYIAIRESGPTEIDLVTGLVNGPQNPAIEATEDIFWKRVGTSAADTTFINSGTVFTSDIDTVQDALDFLETHGVTEITAGLGLETNVGTNEPITGVGTLSINLDDRGGNGSGLGLDTNGLRVNFNASGSGNNGVSNVAARSDHIHDIDEIIDFTAEPDTDYLDGSGGFSTPPNDNNQVAIDSADTAGFLVDKIPNIPNSGIIVADNGNSLGLSTDGRLIDTVDTAVDTPTAGINTVTITYHDGTTDDIVIEEGADGSSYDVVELNAAGNLVFSDSSGILTPPREIANFRTITGENAPVIKLLYADTTSISGTVFNSGAFATLFVPVRFDAINEFGDIGRFGFIPSPTSTDANGSYVRIREAGFYLINAHVTVLDTDTSGTNTLRNSVLVTVQENTVDTNGDFSGAIWAPIGEEGSVYIRNVDDNVGLQYSIQASTIVSAEVDDVYRISVARLNGNGSLPNIQTSETSMDVIGIGVRGQRGDIGPEGPQGDPGADSVVPGPQGDPGADSTVPGPQGDQGIQGIQGDQGLQGIPGNTGSDGQVGATGPQGTSVGGVVLEDADPLDGIFDIVFQNTDVPLVMNPLFDELDIPLDETDPDNRIDATGRSEFIPVEIDRVTTPVLTGPQGIQGDQGIQGIQGIQGETGDSIDRVSLDDSVDPGDGIFDLLFERDTGTVDINNDPIFNTISTVTTPNLTGPQGNQGDQGVQGIQGVQGVQGQGLEIHEVVAFTDAYIDDAVLNNLFFDNGDPAALDNLYFILVISDDRTDPRTSAWIDPPGEPDIASDEAFNHLIFFNGTQFFDTGVVAGAQGIQGPQGDQGVQGPAGNDGADGLDTIENYNAGATYSTGDLVVGSDQGIFRSNVDNNFGDDPVDLTDGTGWERIGVNFEDSVTYPGDRTTSSRGNHGHESDDIFVNPTTSLSTYVTNTSGTLGALALQQGTNTTNITANTTDIADLDTTKLDDPMGTVDQFIDGTGALQPVPAADPNLGDLGDVTIANPVDGQGIVFNAATQQWENTIVSTTGGGGTGTVTPQNLFAEGVWCPVPPEERLIERTFTNTMVEDPPMSGTIIESRTIITFVEEFLTPEFGETRYRIIRKDRVGPDYNVAVIPAPPAEPVEYLATGRSPSTGNFIFGTLDRDGLWAEKEATAASALFGTV